MSGALPNLLVLGDYPIGYANGIGETFSNLLAEYPEGRLFHSHPDHLASLPGSIRGTSLPFRAPMHPAWLPNAIRPLCYPWLKARQALAQRLVFRQVSRWIEEYGIRAVLTYPVSPWLLFAALRLRKAFPGIRFVFYVMDDWEGHHTCFGLPFTRTRRRALAGLIQASDARFACSHAMARDYRQRFGTDWDVLHKGVSCAPDVAAGTAFHGFNRILYAGAINSFRFDAMIAFAEGLQLHRKQTGRNVVLEILGADESDSYARALRRFDFIEFSPWVDNAACGRRIADADLLYLPLAFDRKMERISNLAMPTKFPEYLASGRPVIFHVPRPSEVHEMAASASLPLILSTAQPQDALDLLLSLDRDGVDSVGYRAKAKRLLCDEFDQVRLRRRLEQACAGPLCDGNAGRE